MINNFENNVEVLAPAGDFASLQAAIDNGADAVYFGLAQLNMRARARRSFEGGDLDEIMTRLHDGGVKGCLTMNTLLYDHDIPLARKILEEGKRCNVDAAIISDIASIQMCNEFGIEAHISTQLSISNYEGVKFYAQFADRIVLARELSLVMIKRIHEICLADDLRGKSGRPIEIECFAHGALCIAVSGRCGMSLYTDNASANRGACVQNCRKEYEIVDVDTGQKLKIDNNFVMSPEDICCIDFLDKMIGAGVQTLKLEGRARSPEYVAVVTRTYRKAVDAIREGTYDDAMIESLYEDLKTVYNRGISSGYYLGRKQGWSKVYGSKATRQKQFVGTVSHYFPKLSVAEITTNTGCVKIADEFVIIGDTSGVVKGTIVEMRDDNGVIPSAPAKSVFAIKVDKKVRKNDKFYIMAPVKEVANA